ncbi:hypothetical protein [uncultured Tateyamaria sp.]|uniref:hypothetical protein n=1 Tax=uncultured Tateyamaria sp. TaxID=455651 RepID=UPI002636CC7C|nr:hypothetical protein [uncultured Tateyamaria sp.]
MSNTSIVPLVGCAFVLVSIASAGGFYAGSMSQKIAYLERERDLGQRQLYSQTAPSELGYIAPPNIASEQFPPLVSSGNTGGISGDLGLTAKGVPPQLVPVLSNPESAEALTKLVAQATAFEVGGEAESDQPIFAFFDPACPHCKKAMAEMNGKVRINWIPVSTLESPQAGSVRINGMRTLEGQAAIQAAAEGVVPPAPGSTETLGQLEDNLRILAALYEGSERSIAVPSFIIPKADGTATFWRGYNEGDVIKITEAYGS